MNVKLFMEIENKWWQNRQKIETVYQGVPTARSGSGGSGGCICACQYSANNIWTRTLISSFISGFHSKEIQIR